FAYDHLHCKDRRDPAAVIQLTGGRAKTPSADHRGKGEDALRRHSRGRGNRTATLQPGFYEGNCHTGPCGGSLDSLNCGRVKSSDRSWNTTWTRLPMATFVSASGCKLSSTRLAISRMPSWAVGTPRCSSSSTMTTG